MNKKIQILTISVICCLPVSAFAFADVPILLEVSKHIEDLGKGVKAVGGAIVGVTMVGSGYMLAKRWIRRI